MKTKELHLYLDWAERVSQLSTANRLKVGAVLVNNNSVVYGYNGSPSGWTNVCERENSDGDTVTEDYVLHAEDNIFIKCAADGIKCKGGTLFVTHAPCIKCAIKIIQSGISAVYYKYEYRDSTGILALHKSNIEVFQLNYTTGGEDEIFNSRCGIRQGSLFNEC